jgi:hypothetical protein
LEFLANGIIYLGGNCRIRRCKGKIIDLAKRQDESAINMSNVDVVLMSGRDKTKVMKDGGGVCFPKSSGFRVVLKCMLDGEDMATVESLAKSSFVAIGIGIIDANEGRYIGGWGMGKSILRITTVYQVIKCCREGEKVTTDRLLNTGGIGFSHGMELRCSTR